MGEADEAGRVCACPPLLSLSVTDSQQKTARRQFSTAETNLSESQIRDESLAQSHAREMSEIEQHLSTLRLQQEREEADLREKWKVREKELWARIEAVIQIEEDKVKARLEEERKKREEEEKKKREEELKRKLAEEKRKAEEKKREEEEEERRKEEGERKKREEAEREEERLRKEKEEADAETRKKLGYQTPSEDWTLARESLLVGSTISPPCDLLIPVTGTERQRHGRREI